MTPAPFQCSYLVPHLTFVRAALFWAFIGTTSLWAKSEEMPPEDLSVQESFSTPVPSESVCTRGAADVPVPLPGASSRIDEIKQRGSLRVAVLDEYPWLKQNLAGERPFEGPAWRLAEEFGKRLRVTLETIPVDFNNKVSILASGQVDITIAPLLDTPEREKVVDFVLYSVSAQCLFGLADNPKVARAAQVDDLNQSGITIAYIIGSPQESWLRKRLPNAAMRGVRGSLADVPVEEILSRRADVTTIDKFFFAGLAQKTPGLVSVPKDFLSSQESSIPVGMAIDKNQPAFLEWLRKVAKAIKPQVDAEQIRVERAVKPRQGG